MHKFLQSACVLWVLHCLITAASLSATNDTSSDTPSTFPPASQWCDLLPPDAAKNYKACQTISETTPGSIASITIVDPEVAFLSADMPASKDKIMASKKHFEGDILGIDPGIPATALAKQANFIKDDQRKWPGGVVYYELSSLFRPVDKKVIRDAIAVFQRRTCVVFRERKDTSLDYVYIAPGFGCLSYVGRERGKQYTILQISGCLESGIIQHELMHCVGFYHEQSRTDRDQYVDVNWNNLSEDSQRQFQKYTDAEITAFGEPYDYWSVMHYGMFDFAENTDVYTIRPKSKTVSASSLGQRNALSDIDIKKINFAYCKDTSGPCPTNAGWKQFGKKCYFFSFLAGERGGSFIKARNFCRKHKAIIANAPGPGELLNYLVQSIRAKPSDQDGDVVDNVWTANCQVVNADTSDIQDSDCDEIWHFVCEKNAIS